MNGEACRIPVGRVKGNFARRTPALDPGRQESGDR